MNQAVTYIVLFLIAFIICGIGLYIFYYKWEGFMKAVLKTAREAKKEAGENAVKAEESAQMNETREPFTRARMKQNFAMPCLYVVLLPVFYLLVKWLLNAGKQDMMHGSVIICGLVIGVLILLVLAAFGHQEKNACRKFWLELIPTLGLELMLVFDVYFLLSGYYAERELRGVKSLFYFLVIGIPWFLSYAYKTQRNWKRMITPEVTEQSGR